MKLPVNLKRVLLLVTVLLTPTLISGCYSLPTLEGRTVSHALPPEAAAKTSLGQAVEPLAAAHPGKSGVYPLADAPGAFAARSLLARAAERTLDIQYYIWQKDTTGMMLFAAVHEAANRGVRVRLLLDDHSTLGLDAILAALDAHPNIEVRLFNPFVIRWPRTLGYLTDFARINRRMHNKSFTADNEVTIIGGRNVGDEYFGAAEGILFADLDILAVGPVVKSVSEDFDRYWASGSSYPAERILPPPQLDVLSDVAKAESLAEKNPKAMAYTRALSRSELARDLLQGSLDLEWAHTKMLSDDPAKGLGLALPEELLIVRLREIIGDSASSVDLVTPYFVPTDAGVAALSALVEDGVEIRVLTNSLNATDITPVHAGYAKRRKPLLAAGISLYEMRRVSPEVDRGGGLFGSSGSSLHAKTFAVDNERIFVGSLNFDPRSANLNTELGFIIESPKLARQVSAAFDEDVPRYAYQVHLDKDGDLYWTEQRGDETIRYDTEPNTSIWRRALVRFLSYLPIDGLL